MMDYVVFSSVEINPPIEKNMFNVSFPNGTFVEDFVVKKVYKVGDPVDEDKAIDDFIQRYGFTGDITLPQQRMTPLRYFLMGVGIAMVLFALYQMIQKWRKP
jgi:hypothetical protein